MGSGVIGRSKCAVVVAVVLAATPAVHAQKLFPFMYPGQRTIQVRDPTELPRAVILPTPAPETVATLTELPPRELTLDEAIRTALANARVVRVLAGRTTLVSSGQTIYDTAIVNNGIDEATAEFNPQVGVTNTFLRIDQPVLPGPAPPLGSNHRDQYGLSLDVSKRTTTGGMLSFNLANDATRFPTDPFAPFDPITQFRKSVSYTQPLLQGGGLQVNRVPILLARIETERSFFQFKASVQDLVRSTVQAYWALVSARANLWSRQWQYEQTLWDYRRIEARGRAGLADQANVALARNALAQSRATRISAEADVLDRETTLRDLLGMPPYDSHQTLPMTPPTLEEIQFDWHHLIDLSATYRPDLIELKLILEADEQQLLLAENAARPRVDAVARYRWNGLEGKLPGSATVATSPGQFADWTLGVNFSVPLGLRAERARLRSRELILARDRANLDQGLHSTSHQIALSLRELARFYRQYLALKDAREAAALNLEAQRKAFANDLVDYLNVAQAINSVADASSAEAQALLQYNTELANLELQTGTILEAHSIRFTEEFYGALGPLGRLHHDRPYPEGLPPTLNPDLYPAGVKPAEETFDLPLPEDLGLKPEEMRNPLLPRRLPAP